MGVLYYQLNQFEEAKNYQLKSIKMIEAFGGLKDLMLATFYNNYGVLMHRLEGWEKAKIFFQKSENIHCSCYPEGSPQLVITYSNLAAFYLNHDLEAAKKYIETA